MGIQRGVSHDLCAVAVSDDRTNSWVPTEQFRQTSSAFSPSLVARSTENSIPKVLNNQTIFAGRPYGRILYTLEPGVVSETLERGVWS